MAQTPDGFKQATTRDYLHKQLACGILITPTEGKGVAPFDGGNQSKITVDSSWLPGYLLCDPKQVTII